MNDTNYCVYLHARKDNQEVFYVGSGREERAHSKHGRNKDWQGTVKCASGFHVDVIITGLSKEASILIEQETLLKYPNLTNKQKPSDTKEIIFEDFDSAFYVDTASPTGLRWKDNPKSTRAKYGDVAGYKDAHGYYRVGFKKKQWACHRIVYVLTHGNLSKTAIINHKDTSRENNLPDNLEAISQRENTQRTRRHFVTTCNIFEVKNTKNFYSVRVKVLVQGKIKTKDFSYSKYGLIEAWVHAHNYKIANS